MTEQLYVYGTGNANAIDCYNTCFALRSGDEFIQVDAGGGNGILKILREMKVPLTAIHHIIVTHEHTDHILGIVWMVRMIAAKMRQGGYEGDLRLYCHEDLAQRVRTICMLTLQAKDRAMFDGRIRFVVVEDGQTVDIGGYQVTFFDILSTKAKQFGFTLTLRNGRKLTCMGDEPYNPACRRYAEGADWLLHEAFCLYEDRERFKPYEKWHSTARDAADNARELGVKNLVIWHTEDTDLEHRKARYTKEARERFDGNVLVPDDREIIEL